MFVPHDPAVSLAPADPTELHTDGNPCLMLDEPHIALESLTLPELVASAEQLRRRVIEHIQYDLLHKTQLLADRRESDTGPLFQSNDYSCQLLDRWDCCCSEIQNRIDRIMQES